MGIDHQSLSEFFREQVTEAQERQKVKLKEATQFYVVNLLTEFHDAAKLFPVENDKLVDEPLALIYARAMASPYRTERVRLLKDIGDRSLYVSGFFSDSLKRKIIDIDYYTNMGEHAYGYVSSLAKEDRTPDVFAEIFGELAEKFLHMVDILSSISESAELTSDQDLLRLYERWLQTRSDRLSKKLQKNGIVPVECKREPIH